MERPSIQKNILRRSQEKAKQKNRDDGNREVSSIQKCILAEAKQKKLF
jgi:hypothetical protein